MKSPDSIEAPASADTAASVLPYGGGTPRGQQARRFAIAGDVVAVATADLPDEDRGALRWVAEFGRAKNLPLEEVAAMLKKPDGTSYSRDSLYQALTGRRDPGQLSNIVAAVIKLRAVEEERAGQVETGFIETAVSRRIFAYNRRAFLRRRIGFVIGESQVGKTTAEKEYARVYNHGETTYFRMPTGGSLDACVRELATIKEIPIGNRVEDLRRRLINCFDERNLILVDEAHEALSEHYSAKRGIRTLNFFREIHDRRGTPIVFYGTNVFRDALLRGPHAKNLRQLLLRGLAPLQLADRPGKKDLEVFARAFGLGPAPDEEMGVRVAYLDDDNVEKKETITANVSELQDRIIKEHGLGRWKTILEDAHDTAREKRRALTWSLVIHACHAFERSGLVGGEDAS